MTGKIKYEFSAKPWQYSGPNGWYFVSLPVAMSAEIRSLLRSEEEGWGRLKTTAQIGATKWDTAIWFDTKHNTYLLPIKAEVRKKENIATDQLIKTIVWI